MRVSQPIMLVNPDKLHRTLNKYLEANDIGYYYRAENFYYTIDHLLHLESVNRKSTFVPINLQKLRDTTVSNIDRYIKTLRNGEIILSDNHYIPGEKSLHYRINPKLKEGYKLVELPAHDRLYKKVISEINRERSHDHRMQPHLKAMKKKFMELEYDYGAAEEFIIEKVEPRLQANYISSIQRLAHPKLRYFNRNKTNDRLDTNLTNLSSNLRRFLRPNFFSIDLINSQPLLLGIY